ncbi:MAG: ABC transporter permease [Flavobacteriales bacterium Tduv]
MGGLSISTMALCVILAIFSGLKDLNIKLYKNINPDIKILPSEGKELPVNNTLLQKIHAINGIEIISQTIDEKVYLRYKERNHLSYMKGIDSEYEKITNFRQRMILGDTFSSDYKQGIVVGIGVAQHLSLVLEDFQTPIKIFALQPGKSRYFQTFFTQKNAVATGIFRILEDVDEKYVYGHLSFVQELVGKNGSIYALEIKITPKTDVNSVKKELIKILGPKYTVKTWAEQQEALFKVMNTENFVIYLLLILITLITSFNLIGAIIILKLDKKEQGYTLWSLGLPPSKLKKTFFHTGMIITFIGFGVGILEGYALVFAQYKYGWIKINETIPFPVKFTLYDFLLITFTVFNIGLFISYLSSRKVHLSSNQN